jgi:hypothetical protein
MAYVYHPKEAIKEKGEIARRLDTISKEITRQEESSIRPFRETTVPMFFGFRRFSETVESLFRSALYLLTGDSYEIVLETAGIPAELQAICLRSKPL